MEFYHQDIDSPEKKQQKQQEEDKANFDFSCLITEIKCLTAKAIN